MCLFINMFIRSNCDFVSSAMTYCYLLFFMDSIYLLFWHFYKIFLLIINSSFMRRSLFLKTYQLKCFHEWKKKHEKTLMLEILINKRMAYRPRDDQWSMINTSGVWSHVNVWNEILIRVFLFILIFNAFLCKCVTYKNEFLKYVICGKQQKHHSYMEKQKFT